MELFNPQYPSITDPIGETKYNDLVLKFLPPKYLPILDSKGGNW